MLIPSLWAPCPFGPNVEMIGPSTGQANRLPARGGVEGATGTAAGCGAGATATVDGRGEGIGTVPAGADGCGREAGGGVIAGETGGGVAAAEAGGEITIGGADAAGGGVGFARVT